MNLRSEILTTETQRAQRKKFVRPLRAFAIYFVLAALLWWALRNVPLIVAEYVLTLEFLGVQLNALQVFAALTALQLAFLMPLPGGLGLLLAGRVFGKVK